MAFAALAITWPPSAVHGWGVFGANLIRDLIRRGGPKPILLAPVNETHLDAGDRTLFQPLIAEQAQIEAQFANAGGMATARNVAVIHSLGNGMAVGPISARFRGKPNVGFTFFEQTDLPPDIVQQCAYLDIMMAGSTWNAEVLRDLGFPKVGCVFQGVDLDAFRPGPGAGRWKDRFVVFSGGKLELRKGQDLVLAAFKRFHETHPDALLVTAWMNPWPDLMAPVAESPHVSGAPDGALGFPAAINAWARAEGLPEGAHEDISPVLNGAMPNILRDCDLGLFANRCEGGTNLVAMEAMATGLPCILSANSGHMDLIRNGNCYALTRQTETPFAPAGSDHWRESDVDEMVATLEAAYDDREAAKRKGDAARAFMEDWSWQNQISRLLRSLKELSA
ncbi:MAG: glycosyltransferase family 4 protein [Rhodospirillaceae bacterium]